MLDDCRLHLRSDDCGDNRHRNRHSPIQRFNLHSSVWQSALTDRQWQSPIADRHPAIDERQNKIFSPNCACRASRVRVAWPKLPLGV